MQKIARLGVFVEGSKSATEPKRGKSMARPKKEGLDYFHFDVDFFSDKKIRRLKARFGSDGVLVYLYVLCLIYRDHGYYAEYDEDFILDISDELNISENLTRQILKYLFSRSLLCEIHSTLTVPVNVVSARSIQRRFQEAKRGGKKDVFVKAPFWLLEKSETIGLVKVHPKNDYSEKNAGFSENNADKSEKNTTKESKGKESKVKESVCGCAAQSPPTIEQAAEYIRQKGYRFSPERFVNYYVARGWRSNGDAITNWRAVADNWALMDKQQKPDRQSSFDIDALDDLSMFND